METIAWRETAKLGNLSGKITITPDGARSLIAAVDPAAMRRLADETERYLPQTLEGIAELRDVLASDRTFVVRRAATFGAATPNRHVDTSVEMARAFADTIDWSNDTPQDILRKAMAGYVRDDGRKVGTQLPKPFARTCASLAPYVADGALPSRGRLTELPGLRHKVASMMTAIVNPDWQGWTVDRHHIRQLLNAAGENPRVAECAYSTAQGSTAYYLVEGFFLGWASEHFHGIPTWAVQWACWDVAFGAHQDHSGIWHA